MSTEPSADNQLDTPTSMSEHELLLRMDLSTEVLEGLDELGLDHRADVEALLVRLEQQIADGR